MSATRTRSRVPRRQKRRLHPLAVAALVIAALLAITFYAFNRGVPFVHHFTLNALLTNSVNVRGGDPVRIGGIDVGRVVGVTPAGSGSRIELTLAPSALPIHRDATIRIRDRLFLEGSYYLALDPGTPSAPAIRDGATIPLTRTSRARSPPSRRWHAMRRLHRCSRDSDRTTWRRSAPPGSTTWARTCAPSLRRSSRATQPGCGFATLPPA